MGVGGCFQKRGRAWNTTTCVPEGNFPKGFLSQAWFRVIAEQSVKSSFGAIGFLGQSQLQILCSTSSVCTLDCIRITS